MYRLGLCIKKFTKKAVTLTTQKGIKEFKLYGKLEIYYDNGVLVWPPVGNNLGSSHTQVMLLDEAPLVGHSRVSKLLPML